MPYLLGTNIPENKSVYIGLTKIYGLNQQTALNICYHLGFNKLVLIKDLTTIQLNRLQKFISQNYTIQGILKKEKNLTIQQIIDNKSYRGRRHIMNLPVRGQRTRSNAQTVKKGIK